MDRFGINDFACQVASVGNADGANPVVLGATGKRVFLHSISTGAVNAGTSLAIFHGDGTTRYWNLTGTATSWVDFIGTAGLNWLVDAFLEDGLVLKANGAPAANSGWIVTYQLLT